MWQIPAFFLPDTTCAMHRWLSLLLNTSSSLVFSCLFSSELWFYLILQQCRYFFWSLLIVFCGLTAKSFMSFLNIFFLFPFFFVCMYNIFTLRFILRNFYHFQFMFFVIFLVFRVYFYFLFNFLSILVRLLHLSTSKIIQLFYFYVFLLVMFS